jgi:GntR family transcriptional regulator
MSSESPIVIGPGDERRPDTRGNSKSERVRVSRNFTPRYYQIEQALREVIAHSEIGDALPSESELCEQFGVSRMTARHAMQRLVQDGLVYRVSGHGSFVANAVVHRQASRLLSFSTEMRMQGREPSSDLLVAEERVPTGEERASLKLAGRIRIVAIHRVRLADGVPMAHEQAVMPPRCQAVLEEDLANSSLHALMRELGFRPTHGYATLAAEPATEEDAKLLRVRRGSSILVERRLILDADDKPLEYTTSRYAGERYMLDVAFDVDDTAPDPT